MKTLNMKIKNHYSTIVVCISVILALIVRFLCRNYESGDFTGCLDPWVAEFKANGGWYSLRYNIGNYNVVYQYILIMISYIEQIGCLYLIKLVSVVFDFVLAIGCAACVKVCGGSREKQRICFSVVLLIPTIWLNSAFWAQCDSIYVSLAVWSIYFLLKNNNKTSMAFLALAFSFKLQTIFIMPIYFILFIKKRIKFRELLIFPLTFFITYIPAIAFGKPIADIIYIYVNQTQEYASLSMNAPTMLQIFCAIDPNDLIAKLSIIIAGIFVLLFIILACKKDYSMQMILEYTLIFVIGIPFLLPHMHERYFYFVDIFAVICLFCIQQKYLYILIFAEISSLICYLQYFDYVNRYFTKFWVLFFSAEFAALLMCITLILVLIVVFAKVKVAKKMIVSVISSAMCCLITLNIFSFNDIGASIDGKKVSFVSMHPIVEEDTIWYPLRNFSVAYGAEISYDAERGGIIIESNVGDILITPGSDVAYVNKNKVSIKPVRVIEGFSYISHDDLAKLFNLEYQRDNNVLHYNKK